MKIDKIQKHTLDILIPMYNEGQDTVRLLLDSLAIQQNVDLEDEVGVIICCDGGTTELTDEFMNNYPFDIYFKKCDHKGVSATRNECLNLSKADYVMFCDCDDMFYHSCGLYVVFREINMGKFNVMMSVFTEETRDPKTDDPVYINHDQDMTFVHGKVFNRKYLIKNNIRFNPELLIHEDSYFVCQTMRLTDEIKFCPQPWYLWRFNDDSVCRHDKLYIPKTYGNMLMSNSCLINEFLRRHRKDDAMFFATNMIYDAYMTFNCKEWLDVNNKEYRDLTEEDFAKYWHDFKHLFNDCPEEVKQQIYAGIKNRFMMQGMFQEDITWKDWIKHIENDIEVPEYFSKDPRSPKYTRVYG